MPEDLRDLDEAYKNAQPGQFGVPLPDGLYAVQIQSAQLKISPKQGSRIFELRGIVIGGSDEYHGASIQIPFFLQENAIGFLKEAMQAMGLPNILPSQLQMNLQKFRGMKLRVSLSTKDGRQNRRIEFRISEGQPRTSVTAPAPSIQDRPEPPTDEEVPF